MINESQGFIPLSIDSIISVNLLLILFLYSSLSSSKIFFILLVSREFMPTQSPILSTRTLPTTTPSEYFDISDADLASLIPKPTQTGMVVFFLIEFTD